MLAVKLSEMLLTSWCIRRYRCLEIFGLIHGECRMDARNTNLSVLKNPVARSLAEYLIVRKREPSMYIWCSSRKSKVTIGNSSKEIDQTVIFISRLVNRKPGITDTNNLRRLRCRINCGTLSMIRFGKCLYIRSG